MTTIPAPNVAVQREEWPDADFDLPDDELFHPSSDKDADDDWDINSNLSRSSRQHQLPSTIIASPMLGSASSLPQSQSPVFTIRPPANWPDSISDDDLDEEGVSTIKAAALPLTVLKRPQSPVDDDFEDAFSLPTDLTQLSLAPLSLNHRSSKNSLEWGDKDQTVSSQSSDAYSSLGFADASPSSSNSVYSVSFPDTEGEEDDEEDDLDGLVLPSGLFESVRGAIQLTQILDSKKQAPAFDHPGKVTNPNPEEDFEIGLVIDDDVDLSPSRLLGKQPHHRVLTRSQTAPIPKISSSLRPPSRAGREKSPTLPPPPSRQLQKARLSRHSTRPQNAAVSPAPSPSPSSILPQKHGSLRCQKSYSGLKPLTPPSSSRTLGRKASLSCLIETSHAQASGSGPSSAVATKSRYEEPTVASRAKSHKFPTTRLQDFKVPPTRPHTPSANPAAVRLTLPTQSRTKSRPALASVFGGSSKPDQADRATPPPSRPPSTSSNKSQRLSSNPTSVVPKLLRRPKRQHTYGDGTELDGFDDLPTDREREGRFRVQPKPNCNRLPSATFPTKTNTTGTVRNKGRSSIGSSELPVAIPSPTNTLKRAQSRLDSSKSSGEKQGKKKNVTSSHTKRKPTLIRNLGGTNAPKVVGDMKWNPHTLRWEGNDHVLRDFDAVVGTSTRPALITHLTGSSVGSPVGSFGPGARIVGNMVFDPTKMCWVSTLPPDEDEPDVFANLADDEDENDAWEANGGTIRASLHFGSEPAPSAEPSVSSRAGTPSPAHSHSRTISDSGSDRGSRASIFFDVDETFSNDCKVAEERHKKEMKAWIPLLKRQNESSAFARSSLYEIRALATRQY